MRPQQTDSPYGVPGIAVQDTSEHNVIFIHSALDDANLTAPQFRVLAHLSRRAGKNGAYPGERSIARVCRIHRTTVICAIQALERRGMIAVKRENGRRNHYILTAPSQWKTSTSRNKGTVDQSEMRYGSSQNKGTVPVGIRERKDIHIRISTKASSRVRAREPIVDDPESEALSYAEQQSALSEIANKAFGRPIRPADWSNPQKQTWLSDAQPVTPSELEALQWLYGLSDNHPAMQRTRRRQTLEKLLEFLRGEIDKARAVRGQTSGFSRKKDAAENGQLEPPGWQDTAATLWGLEAPLPAHFGELSGTAQAEVMAGLAERKKEEAAA